MSALSIEGVVASVLPGFDEDLVGYIVAILEQMEIEERQNSDVLNEAIVPFIVDSEYANESTAVLLCRKISVAFGGSGFKSKNMVRDDAPELLVAPVRLQDSIQPEKKTYGGVVFADVDGSTEIVSNSEYDASSVPKDLRSKRKIQKENEQLARKLRLEAARDAERRIEMAAARMAAIRASRQSSRSKAHTGVHIDSFSLPHPSGRYYIISDPSSYLRVFYVITPTGTGDLLGDATLILSYGHRYGLVGRNGAGKTTLMRSLASYALPGLDHLKIMLVDQHVEGDESTPMEVSIHISCNVHLQH